MTISQQQLSFDLKLEEKVIKEVSSFNYFGAHIRSDKFYVCEEERTQVNSHISLLQGYYYM